MNEPLRVLHCPTTVGGNSSGLARAERQLGLHSVAVTFAQNYLAYDIDVVLASSNVLRQGLRRLWLFERAIAHFDIIHFNFGETILPRPGTNRRGKHRWLIPVLRILEMIELPLLRRAGKGIVVTYQGDDARQGDYSLAHFPICLAREVEQGYYSSESDEIKRRRIGYFDRYADRIYALNPDLLHVLPPRAQFLGYAHVDPRTWLPVNRQCAGGDSIRVLHAPTHRAAKGTKYIVAAVERLKSEGIQLEFTLVEKTSYSEARRMYERADLLVDQLLAGWYGGLALEFMALGKPAIAYIREGDMRFIPEQMRRDLPIINATPETVYWVLREWLTIRRSELLDAGRRSRAFAERWHDPLRIAAGLKAEYEAIIAARR
jgi:hypothetical protein